MLQGTHGLLGAPWGWPCDHRQRAAPRWRPGERLEVGREATTYLKGCEDDALGYRITPRSTSTSVEVLWAGCRLAGAVGPRIAHSNTSASILASLPFAHGVFSFRTGGIDTHLASDRPPSRFPGQAIASRRPTTSTPGSELRRRERECACSP